MQSLRNKAIALLEEAVGKLVRYRMSKETGPVDVPPEDSSEDDEVDEMSAALDYDPSSAKKRRKKLPRS